MRVLQFFYTRKKGIMGHIEAARLWVSEGILESEKDEILNKLKLISFNDESDLPYYSFFKLKSERYCVWMIKSRYDETEEFSCHGLIPEDGHFPFYPVELLGSPVFSFEVIEEDLKNKNLPVLSDIPLEGKITYDRLSEFIKPRMGQGFREMINAALEYKKNGFGIFICDDEGKLPLWIGIMQMSFPLKIAHGITFSTAFTEGSRDFMINCSTGNMPVQIEDLNRDYIFDYKRGIRGKPTSSLKFIRIVEVGYSVSKRTLDMFHKFLSQFEYTELDEYIDGCYNLFMLAYLHQTGINNRDIEKAFEFAYKYGPQDVLDDIYEMAEPSFETLVRSVDIEAAKPLASYLFKTALYSKKLILLSRACYFFFNLLDHMIMDGRSTDVESLLQFYNDMKSFCADRAHALIKYSTEQERINYLSTLLSENCSCQLGEFYIRLTLDSFIELGYLWNQMINIKDMAVLMDNCITATMESSHAINTILDTAAKSDEYFTKVIMLFYNRMTSTVLLAELINKLSSILDNQDEERVLSIRKQISSMGGGKLLLEDLSIRLSMCENKIEFFDNYQHQVFDKIPVYEKEFYSEAVKIYIKILEKDNLFPECMKILKELVSNNILIDDESTELLIRVFEEGLPLTPASADIREIIPAVKKIKKARNITTYPDITGMVDFALWLENAGNNTFNLSELLEELKGTGSLDPNRYMQYTAWCIPLLLNVVNTPEDHKIIIYCMAKDDMDTSFYSDYLKIISDIVDQNSKKGVNIFVQFCVYFFFYLEPKLKILEEEGALDKINNIILDILINRSKHFCTDVDHGIRMAFSSRSLSMPVKWTQIYSEVIDKKKVSIIGSISGIFNRKGKI